MVSIKSKPLTVLIVEVDASDGEKVLEKLREKIKGKFFSKSGMPFLIKPKGNVSSDVLAKVENFLREKGFVPVLEERKGNSRGGDFKTVLSESLEKLPSNDVLLLRKNLRAGQKVEHSGDVVIVGDVNPGAEVRATGNIFVFGTLKGLAWAGYLGNRDAIIVATKMAPAQLRIANIVAINEEPQEISKPRPEYAKIEGDEIVIRPFG